MSGSIADDQTGTGRVSTRFALLCEAYCCNSLNGEQRQELARLVQDDPALEQMFCEQVALHVRLHGQFEQPSTGELAVLADTAMSASSESRCVATIRAVEAQLGIVASDADADDAAAADSGPEPVEAPIEADVPTDPANDAIDDASGSHPTAGSSPHRRRKSRRRGGGTRGHRRGGHRGRGSAHRRAASESDSQAISSGTDDDADPTPTSIADEDVDETAEADAAEPGTVSEVQTAPEPPRSGSSRTREPATGRHRGTGRHVGTGRHQGTGRHAGPGRQTGSHRRGRKLPKWFAPSLIAAVAVAAVVIVVYLVGRGESVPPPPPLALVKQGMVTVGDTSRFEGDAIKNDGTWTCEGSSLVELADGTRLRFADTAVLSLSSEAHAITLQRGAVVAEVSPQQQGRPWQFGTAHLQVSVMGTSFRLQTDEAGSRVEMRSGRITASSRIGSERQILVSGEWAAVTADGVWSIGPEDKLAGTAGSGEPTPVAELPAAGNGKQLLVLNGEQAAPIHAVLIERLRAEGYGVTVRAGLPRQELDAFDALVVFDSVSSSDLQSKPLAKLPIPILCFEAWLFDDLQLTGPREDEDYGVLPSAGRVHIVDPSHPVVAGMEGIVDILAKDAVVKFGRVVGDVKNLAHVEGNSTACVVLVADQGAKLVSMTAQERRVGLGTLLHHQIDEAHLNDQWWQLFLQAVAYTAE